MAARRAGEYRLRRGVFAVLLLAVGLGVLAALLANPLNSTPGPNGPHPIFGVDENGAFEIQLAGIAAFLLIAAYLGFLIYRRASAGRGIASFRLILAIAVYFALAIAFLVVAHLVAPLLPVGHGGTGPANNTTGTAPTGGSPNASAPGNGTHGGAFGGGPIPAVPAFTWVDFGLLGLAAILAVGAYRYLVYRIETGPDEGHEELSGRLRADLLDSLRRLEEDPDPRAAIRGLYQRMLLTVQPRFRQIPESTPREIAEEIIDRFGVRPENARALTDLFEEARYSSHPLTAADVDRARRALSSVLQDLDAPLRRRPAA
jgi:hypothetical protein